MIDKSLWYIHNAKISIIIDNTKLFCKFYEILQRRVMKGGEPRQRVLFDSNKKILLCRHFAQQTVRATALTGDICPRDSDKFYLIQINLSPESGFQNLDTLTSPYPL